MAGMTSLIALRAVEIFIYRNVILSSKGQMTFVIKCSQNYYCAKSSL